MWRIFYPIQYFRLSNADKRRIDVIPTFVLALLIAIPFIVVGGASFFKANGFLDRILTLTAGLTGFYVAALVAAATFLHPDLDKPIKTGPVVLITKEADGTINREALTRREFACMIFGYLAASTLLLSLAISFVVGISTANWSTLLGGSLLFVRGALLLCFAIWISHIVTVTALGLFYLMDRLHRDDLQITTKKSDVQ
ncbi:hypothetical protein IVB36_38915 [Bradyrhizobium sp. 35]|uniref:hypothetical protein n=1 Tax=Bradyrhizobium sp. 35 TaxID=2782670 RepID=UPI001FFA0F23|nr:hypothetical protein [Bradyrhizobium sp. 35]MCK1456697.1 hypothetical protein [Bradyrhizobium sp. 35]